LNTEVPLSALIEAGLRSQDVDEIAQLHGTLLMSCLSAREVHPPGVYTRQNMLVILGKDNGSLVDSVMRSKATLLEFCGAVAGDGEKEFFEYANLRRKSGAGKAVVARGLGGHGDSWQRTIMVLSNPEKYWGQMDSWLRVSAAKDIPELGQLDFQQQNWVQDYLYHELTKTQPDQQSLRTLNRCFLENWCPDASTLSGQKLDQAQQLAARLTRLIREQRWAELAARH
jgi:hypothetical protein